MLVVVEVVIVDVEDVVVIDVVVVVSVVEVVVAVDVVDVVVVVEVEVVVVIVIDVDVVVELVVVVTVVVVVVVIVVVVNESLLQMTLAFFPQLICSIAIFVASITRQFFLCFFKALIGFPSKSLTFEPSAYVKYLDLKLPFLYRPFIQIFY